MTPGVAESLELRAAPCLRSPATTTVLRSQLRLDPLFGPYADWDLFSYIAVITSLVGGFGFVVWARGHARVAGVVLGVVLAANVTHLVAKLNGLELDFEKHIQESPWHGDGALFVPHGSAGRDPARTADLARRQKRRDAAANAAGLPAP